MRFLAYRVVEAVVGADVEVVAEAVVGAAAEDVEAVENNSCVN